MTTDRRQLKDRRATVMGLGSFGGGAGVVRFLHAQGARVTVTDLRTESQLVRTLSELSDLSGVDWRLGEHHEDDFQGADLVVVNPAVRPGHPLVELARSGGAEITTEIELFWERVPPPIAAVTGTNGKSSTAKLLYHLIETDGRRAWLGGNIGGSLLPDVDRIREGDWVVLELSSFQLVALDRMHVSPHLAVVTNFAPNHLDWHGDLESYRYAKQAILRRQHAEDAAVLNAHDAVRSWETRGRRLLFDRDAFPGREQAENNPSLAGTHQRENAAAAATAAQWLGVDEEAIAGGMQTFVGLPHRLQLVGTMQGRRWYDDSASTTPESTLAALAGLDGRIVLLVGGADKGVDLSPLADGIARGADAAVLMGALAPRLRDLIAARLELAEVNASRRLGATAVARSLDEAVQQALDLSRPGDAVLLSPGCASYGWFANYVERGLAFAARVRAGAV